MLGPIRIVVGAGFAATLVGFAAPAVAQSLLDDILPQAGVCTCATIQPPNDCDSALAEPRSIATEQRRAIRAQCATDWRAGCEEQYGWQACASQEASAQLAAQCDGIAERWWTEVAAPQIRELSGQCDAANAAWVEQCETVIRPQECRSCDDMGGEIAQLESDIAEAQAWLDGMRNGAAVLTPDDEAAIAQRVDEVDRWERDLAEKREGFELLQSSEYCPRS